MAILWIFVLFLVVIIGFILKNHLVIEFGTFLEKGFKKIVDHYRSLLLGR